MISRRRALTLLLVLVSLALLAVLVTPLAALSGTTAMEAAHRAADLQHRLATDSAISLLPALLGSDPRHQEALDERNRTTITMAVGDVHVELFVQDDTAKLPLALLAPGEIRTWLPAALDTLASELALPPLALQARDRRPTRPPWTGCVEDLFTAATDPALYGRTADASRWMHYLSPVGQRVQVFRAAEAVLDATLNDIQARLGDELARRCDAQVEADLAALLAGLELPGAQLRMVAARLTDRTERYSLLVRTEVHGDVRQRFIICTAGATPEVLLDWEVAP